MAKAKTKKPTTTRKVAKKPTAKKATAKKPVAKKPATKAKAKTPAKKTTATKKTSNLKSLKLPATKRPDSGDPISLGVINTFNESFTIMKEEIEEFSAHMRPLDRLRLNGIGIKRQGFTERAYALAEENTEFLPHWLTIAKFKRDMDIFIGLRNLVDLTKQIEELLWNLTMQASDMAYTDALEFYSQVQDAARRRIDAAESPYEELHGFFRHGKRTEDEPTIDEVERDMHSLLKGRKDGKIVIENHRPQTTGGSRKVVDETYRDKASFKDTEEGAIE